MCMLCQPTSSKRWFAYVNMTSYCDVTNSACPITIITIRHCWDCSYNQAVAMGITRPLHATGYYNGDFLNQSDNHTKYGNLLTQSICKKKSCKYIIFFLCRKTEGRPTRVPPWKPSHTTIGTRTTFLELLSWSKVGARFRLNVPWCASKRINTRTAIIMSDTMTPCSTAILAAKGILQILNLQHQDFQQRICREVLRSNGGFDPK